MSPSRNAIQSPPGDQRGGKPAPWTRRTPPGRHSSDTHLQDRKLAFDTNRSRQSSCRLGTTRDRAVVDHSDRPRAALERRRTAAIPRSRSFVLGAHGTRPASRPVRSRSRTTTRRPELPLADNQPFRPVGPITQPDLLDTASIGDVGHPRAVRCPGRRGFRLRRRQEVERPGAVQRNFDQIEADLAAGKGQRFAVGRKRGEGAARRAGGDDSAGT